MCSPDEYTLYTKCCHSHNVRVNCQIGDCPYKSGQWKRLVNKHDIDALCQACKDIPKPNSNQLADMQKALDGKMVEKNDKKFKSQDKSGSSSGRGRGRGRGSSSNASKGKGKEKA